MKLLRITLTLLIAIMPPGFLSAHPRIEIPLNKGAISMKIVLHHVWPEYPSQARRSHITGDGVVFGQVDSKTGNVTSVKMEESTGHRLLDYAALNAFREWRFRPGTIRQFRLPIHFTMVD